MDQKPLETLPSAKRLAVGSLAGALATVVMTGVILGAKMAGFLYNPPPKHITGKVGKKLTGKNPERAPEPAVHATWLAAHLGFGVGCGVVYALLHSLMRRIWPRRGAVTGVIYGLGVWAVSYMGLMPALGLYPWPEEDSPSRTATMIAAHAVYGAALGEIEGVLSSES